MGTPGIAGLPSPPSAANSSRSVGKKKRSVMARFTSRVTVPVGLMGAGWVVLTAVILGGVFGSPGHWSGTRATFLVSVIVVLALAIVVVALMRTTRFVRDIAAESRELAVAAQRIADVRLPAELERLRAGGDPGDNLQAAALTTSESAELADAAGAIADLHRAALTSATAEASLRGGLRNVLVSLGRRNQSLIHRQLKIIDKLEKTASGSSELGDLFTLDHLTTRMRRHAESLTVLAGEAPGRAWGAPVPVVDVMRAAAAEVEDYKRVIVRADTDQAITAPAVTDMIHLLAELIENATLFSPSSTKVEVKADSAANGFVIEIDDRGLGIPSDQLREINAQLAHAPDEDLVDADRLGLFVASKLAARHGVQVSLTPSPYRGTKAVVVLPAAIVTAAPSDPARMSGEQEAVGTGRLDLSAPGVLALAGSDMARRSSDPVTAGPSVFTPSLESLTSHDSRTSRDGFGSADSGFGSSADSFGSGSGFGAPAAGFSSDRLPSADSVPGALRRRDSFPGETPGGDMPRRDSLPSWDTAQRRAIPADSGPLFDPLPPSDQLPSSGRLPSADRLPSSGRLPSADRIPGGRPSASDTQTSADGFAALGGSSSGGSFGSASGFTGGGSSSIPGAIDRRPSSVPGAIERRPSSIPGAIERRPSSGDGFPEDNGSSGGGSFSGTGLSRGGLSAGGGLGGGFSLAAGMRRAGGPGGPGGGGDSSGPGSPSAPSPQDSLGAPAPSQGGTFTPAPGRQADPASSMPSNPGIPGGLQRDSEPNTGPSTGGWFSRPASMPGRTTGSGSASRPDPLTSPEFSSRPDPLTDPEFSSRRDPLTDPEFSSRRDPLTSPDFSSRPDPLTSSEFRRPDSPAGGLPSRRDSADGGLPSRTSSPLGGGLPSRDSGAPAGEAPSLNGKSSAGGGTKPALPRRVRTKQTGAPAPRPAGPPPAPEASAARSLASSLQSSWLRSQDEDVPGPGPGSDGKEES